jgi:beta-aspartyl-peptidase (threonine type)
MPADRSPDPAPWTLVVHGGSGSMERGDLSDPLDAGARGGLARALDAGAALLASGGGALDAAEAAVRVLEDDPHFNAGRGSVFTYEGVNELDAAVMQGETLAAGAVTGVTRTRNPVSLARAVMERSPHVLLSGAGADRFSAEHGLDQADADYFRVEEGGGSWRR